MAVEEPGGVSDPLASVWITCSGEDKNGSRETSTSRRLLQ